MRHQLTMPTHAKASTLFITRPINPNVPPVASYCTGHVSQHQLAQSEGSQTQRAELLQEKFTNPYSLYETEEMFEQTTLFSLSLSAALLSGPVQASQAPVPVTIFVHGTSLVAGQLVYSAAGLQPLDTLSSIDVAYRFGTALSAADRHGFPAAHCYSFGWGGALDHQVRRFAAGELSRALLKLQDAYRRIGRRISVTLITHSHGGNVALLLAEAWQQLSPAQQRQVAIDRLIMLACPVQKLTCELVKHQIFKRVYVFYSQWDIIQVVAPQLSEFQRQVTVGQLPGSERIFPVAPHVYQASICAGWRNGIGHLEFIFQSFARKLPNLLRRLDWHATRPTPRFLQGKLSLDLTKI